MLVLHTLLLSDIALPRAGISLFIMLFHVVGYVASAGGGWRHRFMIGNKPCNFMPVFICHVYVYRQQAQQYIIIWYSSCLISIISGQKTGVYYQCYTTLHAYDYFWTKQVLFLMEFLHSRKSLNSMV